MVDYKLWWQTCTAGSVQYCIPVYTLVIAMFKSSAASRLMKNN